LPVRSGVVSTTTPQPPSVLGWWRGPVPVLVVGLAGGLAVGIATQILQGVLPGNWNVLANSGVAWAIGAFLLGMLLWSDVTAAVAGGLAMAVAAISYYWAVEWFEGIESDGTGARIWAAAGLVAGPFFGVAGRWFRARPGWRWLALAPVAGILLGEGVHLIWFVDRDELRPAGVFELVLAALVAAWCLWRDRRRPVVLGLVAGAAVCFWVAEQIIDNAFA
jgi:hypothetical protein